MDDEFVIRAVSEAGEEVVRFDGLAGLEDHQDGKMDIFDEVFELTSFRFDTGPVAIAHTTCVWTFRRREPRAATEAPSQPMGAGPSMSGRATRCSSDFRTDRPCSWTPAAVRRPRRSTSASESWGRY